MSFDNMRIEEFTEALASKEAIPGGGGASALVGSIGICLGNMVGSLTVGKKKYADVEEEMKLLMEKSNSLRKELLALMDKDAETFAPLVKAYGIPKDDPDRDTVMEKALYMACQAPMDIMRTVCKALDIMVEFAAKGSILAISDAGVGAVCCKAALQGAFLNVLANTKLMKDSNTALNLEREADKMLDKYCKLADEIYATAASRMK